MEDGTGDQYLLSDVHDSTYSPILISFVATLSTVLGVVIYHLILVHFCQQPRSLRESITERVTSSSSSSSLDINGYSRDQGSVIGPRGLDNWALESIPVLPYSDRAREFFKIDGTECVVCLTRLEKGEWVRWLPGCTHTFHVACIDSWLHARASCPTCRTPVVVPPRLLRQPKRRGEDRDGSGGLRRVKSGGSQMMMWHRTVEEEAIRAGLKRSLSMDHSCVVLINLEVGEVLPHGGGGGDRSWSFLQPSPPPVDWRLTLTRSVLGFDALSTPNIVATV